MAFQLSPGINISEVDLTNSTPAVGTTEGAIAGVFRWGPTNERVLITSEQELVNRFGAPSTRYTNAPTNTQTWQNHETFLTAANFLAYSDALYVARADTGGAAATEAGENFSAKYTGELGNSIGVSHCVTDANGVSSFGASSTVAGGAIGTLAINASSTSGTINGITKAQADAIVIGDIITPTHADSNKESLTIATRTVGGGDGTETTLTVNADDNLDAAAAVASGGLVAEGIITELEDSVTTVQSSIISLDADDTIETGDAVRFDANGFAALTVTFADGTTGSLVDEQTYFAIRVNDGTDTSANLGKLLAGGATRAIKLALTYDDAINHLDGTPKNIKFTTKPSDASAIFNFIKSSKVFLNVTFTSRYTGHTNLTVAAGNGSITRQWGDADLFDAQPSTSHAHVVVKDIDGKITGTAGSIVEMFENVSMIAGAKSFDGTSNYISDVLTASSNWIALTPANSVLATFKSQVALTGGTDGSDEQAATLAQIAPAYDLFKDAADVDISLVLQGKASSFSGATGTELSNYIIDNICEVRRDCVAFISPKYEASMTASSIVASIATLSASSYAVVDSGYKYQYDKYSDVYRWIPLNGDIAGLCARTDDQRDPWFSPAGYNRGNVKNVVKLKVNPNKAQRDLLYKNNINPVITQPGQGTVLFGDKTYSGTTSAFDRINVRRLFIVLEKTIGSAAKSTLFEFNDEFTRASFVNLVEPFLRDVQGRRGIFDFKVVCDATNNTPGVIDANQFVGDIYIKPARSINFIQLNFVAVRSGVEFSEIVGAA